MVDVQRDDALRAEGLVQQRGADGRVDAARDKHQHLRQAINQSITILKSCTRA